LKEQGGINKLPTIAIETFTSFQKKNKLLVQKLMTSEAEPNEPEEDLFSPDLDEEVSFSTPKERNFYSNGTLQNYVIVLACDIV